MCRFEVITDLPWGDVSYEDALNHQAELAGEGRYGVLLFSCHPTVTLGYRAGSADLKVDPSRFEALGIKLLRADRGGLATYHGPGQIVGFPFGTLKALSGDPRGVRRFVEALTSTLASFVKSELSDQTKIVETVGQGGRAGVWVRDTLTGSKGKIVAIGMKFGHQGIRHGFALNVNRQDQPFSLIHPCGDPGARPASLFPDAVTEEKVLEVRRRLAGALLESKIQQKTSEAPASEMSL